MPSLILYTKQRTLDGGAEVSVAGASRNDSGNCRSVDGDGADWRVDCHLTWVNHWNCHVATCQTDHAHTCIHRFVTTLVLSLTECITYELLQSVISFISLFVTRATVLTYSPDGTTKTY